MLHFRGPRAGARGWLKCARSTAPAILHWAAGFHPRKAGTSHSFLSGSGVLIRPRAFTRGRMALPAPLEAPLVVFHWAAGFSPAEGRKRTCRLRLLCVFSFTRRLSPAEYGMHFTKFDTPICLQFGRGPEPAEGAAVAVLGAARFPSAACGRFGHTLAMRRFSRSSVGPDRAVGNPSCARSFAAGPGPRHGGRHALNGSAVYVFG